MSEGRIKAWLDTPLKPRTRKTVLIAAVVDGVFNTFRADRIKRLEARIASLEADRRAQKANLK